MTIPARVKQADIARILKEAKKHGAKRVHVAPDGSIDIFLNGEPPEDPPPEDPPPPRRGMFRTKPKKKVAL
jgi:hypothetical protein